MKPILGVMLACLALFSACHKADRYGTIDLQIRYSVNDGPLVCDTLSYVNEAGNHFMINEIQWFLSHIELQDSEGQWTAFGDEGDCYYIDTNLPETHLLHSKPLPAKQYSRMRFTFGLDENDNITGRFPNPPESNMFWPEPLGGGYHYMKLNGKWRDDEGHLAPLNIHLGIGQNESLTEFYPNHFAVALPIDLDLQSSQPPIIDLTMVIDNWFRNPHRYDFSIDGTSIMQNQEAQVKLKENGSDVFIIKETETRKPISDLGREIMRKAAPKPHFMTWEHLKNTFSEIKNTFNRS